MKVILTARPCIHPLCGFVTDLRREETLGRPWEESQEPQKEEEEGPQRTTEASVSLRTLLQGHAGCHQGAEPQRHLRGCVQNCGLHVGQFGRGAEAGEPLTPSYDVP